ncbi:hypothetical protein [Afifella marina]|uniref:Uncharacterized protein n=1 Tax=Afifella marina DSM 2698 TaxID=1120955 RepID=A0A1G5P1J1_AFIMA|nr:hypothetical protein [Afifella marina]SCZ43426.1 hypothetical protein SAMN03080610_03053 [Afifella marina DSM 2698]
MAERTRLVAITLARPLETSAKPEVDSDTLMTSNDVARLGGAWARNMP